MGSRPDLVARTNARRAVNTEGHRQLNQLLEAALALPRSERIAFAQRECGADKVLLAEITALLSSESDAAAWLPAPPFQRRLSR